MLMILFGSKWVESITKMFHPNGCLKSIYHQISLYVRNGDVEMGYESITNKWDHHLWYIVSGRVYVLNF